ncbi:MAG: IscS subfamily cysteine desulfurase [Terriglobia bacterium]
MKLPIYLDYHATTPVDPRVLEAMLPYFYEKFGNAASRSHSLGWDARDAVEIARRQIADLIHARPQEIVFTSGATESNNLALKGTARAHQEKGNHLITLATEHKAVLDPCRSLEQEGFRVTFLPVSPDGLVDIARLEAALTPATILVSVMAAHNETGVIQPVGEIGRICRARGILFHSDAAQAAGKIPLDVEAMRIDLMSLSAHKIYGPKGAGAIYVRERKPPIDLAPMMDGGGHERGLRSGTLNVPGIVGLGVACALAKREMPEESARLGILRDRLRDGILARVDNARVNGSMEHRLPHNLNLSFSETSSDMLLTSLNDIALSAGSACTSARREPSYVLQAMGVPDELAYAALRFGLGRFTTTEEVDYAIERIAETVTALRNLRAAPQPLESA